MSAGFQPPPYPQDRLAEVRRIPAKVGLELVDLSIGTPVDPVPELAMALAASLSLARGYPSSPGSLELRLAASGWMSRRFGVEVPAEQIAATVGSKEFVAGLPAYLRLRDPSRDVVLYPAVSYPTYAMGATLAGCRAVAVEAGPDGELDLDSIDPSLLDRALCCWVNTPSNPTGRVSGYDKVVRFARAHGFFVVADECYVEFVWDRPARTVLEHGTEGILAVHSLSKRSNFAGGRVGFYAGDAELVGYLSEVRKHAGLMIPGPMQAIGAALLGDQEHVEVQRGRYRERLEILLEIAASLSLPAEMPEGGFYLWVSDPERDGFELAAMVAEATGIVGSPGEFYGPGARNCLRIAAVARTEKLAAIAASLK